MFIGHFGAALAARKVDKSLSLGIMFAAAQFIDLLLPVLMLTGIEKVKIDPGNTAFTPLDFVHYPWSHSFLTVLVWAFLFSGIHFAFKHKLKGSLILGGLVLSHWFLDLIVHRPDLPLFPGSGIKVGFGLWNSVFFSILIEGGIFTAGIFLYTRVKKFKSKKKAGIFWSLTVFLFIIYAANILGPLPPGPEAVALSGMLMWIFVVWAYFSDSPSRSEKDNLTVPE